MFYDVDRRGILAIEAAARFLRRCRDERDLLASVQAARVALKRPGPRIVSKLEVLAAELASPAGRGHGPGPQISPRALEAVCELAERLCVPLLPIDHPAVAVLRCRVAAEVLEAGWGASFATALRLRGDDAAEIGDPVPRIRPDLPALLNGKLMTAVKRLDEFRIDELERLGLATTRGARFAIASSRDMFPEPHADLRVAWFDPLSAVRFPGEDAGDRDARLVVTRPADESVAGLFHVFPVETGVNAARAIELLKAADGWRVEIAIAPELSIAHETISEVRAWLETADHVRMIVCGSAHVPLAGEPKRFVNRITVLVRRAGQRQVRAFTHDKFNVFDLLLGKHTYFEDIACGPPTITSLVVADWNRAPGEDPLRWSYAVSLCKDLMSDAFPPLFGDARAALLLAPLMSPRTATFDGIIHDLAARHQTTSVLANHNTRDAQPAVMVRRPVEGGAWEHARPAPDEVSVIVLTPFRNTVVSAS